MDNTNSNHIRHVGLAAGQRLMQLGTASDVNLFFSCIPYAAVHHQEKSWELILDRLYRRYLRPEDFDHSVGLMHILKTWFFAQPSSFVDWSQMEPRQSTLNHKAQNLGQVFAKFFSYFDISVSAAKYQVETLGYGTPGSVVRLVIADMGDFIKYDQERPLADYEKLSRNASPFWSLPDQHLA